MATVALSVLLSISPSAQAQEHVGVIEGPGLEVTPSPEKLPYGRWTCKNGFVWREAYNGDVVCVTPQTRAQTAYDNRLAPYRINPGGGDFGPFTCKYGFVWREAYNGDLVCVTPQTRAQTAYDNRLAPNRRVIP